ncbi:hypothetical protein CHS0354_024773 [Potamilus streckersoni]|uniref:Uncharacterized protein n=1 Tax=Potamilus streckersoni TaxID=2493646 RepID=A0AAE0RXP0_9BIVA|nr:hypothetical protein CHS0354_024773 [Potamilus streckersoni]
MFVPGATYAGTAYAQKVAQKDGNINLNERDYNDIQDALSYRLEQRATTQTKEVRNQIEDSDPAPNETADQLRKEQVWGKFLSPINEFRGGSLTATPKDDGMTNKKELRTSKILGITGSKSPIPTPTTLKRQKQNKRKTEIAAFSAILFK